VADHNGPIALVEIIFDPSTYRFIGLQTIISGKIVTAYALVKSAIVNSAPPGANGESN
jgi:hypothetical protein